ncbi:YggT family protein [Arcanobacterium canis]
MALIGYLLFWAIQIYLWVLIARVVLDLVGMLARDWTPTGVLMVMANAVYRVTDPPLRFLGRYIPPLRFGAITFDMGFLVLFFGLQVLARIVFWVF